MISLSTGVWSGMTVLEMDRGHHEPVLVLPLHRSAIIDASFVIQSIGTMIQSLIIVGLRPHHQHPLPGTGHLSSCLLVVSSTWSR